MQQSERVREILHRKYEEIRNRNSGFSMRSFASRLGLSSGALSEVMAGKRPLSPKKIKVLLQTKLFEPQERSELAHAAGFVLGWESGKKSPRYTRLSTEQFQVIADWWHYAILNLIQTRDFRADPKWIGARLGLDPGVVEEALFRLKELRLVREEKGTLVRTHARVTTSDDKIDLPLQRGNLGLIKLAGRRLKKVPVELRDVTSYVMAVNPARLPQAKTAIRRLQDELSIILEGEDASEVYQLGIQLFPISQPSEPT
jgi:transcriptional regulator with XRE-family HTH domain